MNPTTSRLRRPFKHTLTRISLHRVSPRDLRNRHQLRVMSPIFLITSHTPTHQKSIKLIKHQSTMERQSITRSQRRNQSNSFQVKALRSNISMRQHTRRTIQDTINTKGRHRATSLPPVIRSHRLLIMRKQVNRRLVLTTIIGRRPTISMFRSNTITQEVKSNRVRTQLCTIQGIKHISTRFLLQRFNSHLIRHNRVIRCMLHPSTRSRSKPHITQPLMSQFKRRRRINSRPNLIRTINSTSIMTHNQGKTMFQHPRSNIIHVNSTTNNTTQRSVRINRQIFTPIRNTSHSNRTIKARVSNTHTNFQLYKGGNRHDNTRRNRGLYFRGREYVCSSTEYGSSTGECRGLPKVAARGIQGV